MGKEGRRGKKMKAEETEKYQNVTCGIITELMSACYTMGELSERECEAKAPILFQLEISVCVITLGGRVVKAWVHEELCGYEL